MFHWDKRFKGWRLTDVFQVCSPPIGAEQLNRKCWGGGLKCLFRNLFLNLNTDSNLLCCYFVKPPNSILVERCFTIKALHRRDSTTRLLMWNFQEMWTIQEGAESLQTKIHSNTRNTVRTFSRHIITNILFFQVDVNCDSQDSFLCAERSGNRK